MRFTGRIDRWPDGLGARSQRRELVVEVTDEHELARDGRPIVLHEGEVYMDPLALEPLVVTVDATVPDGDIERVRAAGWDVRRR